jgi:hypothetical protein
MWGYISEIACIWDLTAVELLFYNRTNLLILEEAMNLTTTQRFSRITNQFFKNVHARSSSLYMAVIILALAAFEYFNFSTTDFALQDILGNHGSGLMAWSTILSLAFCGMGIAGIAKILASPKDDTGNKSSWYLLGAWVIAAAMNAGLIWWGISVAIYNQPAHAVMIIDPMTYVTVVPVLVAVIIWVIRVLIIGTLVTSFDLVLKGSEQQRKPVQKKAFGFRTEKKASPPGYKPVPTRASADYEGFPR